MLAAGPEKKATIFDIGRYRNEDGPGIRTMVFFKGCSLICIWCSNPFGLSKGRQLAFNNRKCAKCRKCTQVCPNGANHLEGDTLQVDFAKCKSCGKCVLTCLANARSISGTQYTVRELFAEIQKDAPFYRRNDGGVTLSGGEVLMQSEFASELLRSCKQDYINTAIETSGHSTWEDLESVARYCDLVFIDLKIMDAKKHKEYTGVGNELILRNIEKLCAYSQAMGAPRVIIRRLIIEGLTDNDDETIRAAKFINGLPGHPEINLLPFHNLGEAKYSMIGRQYSLQDKKMMRAVDPKILHVHDLTFQHAPGCHVSVGGENIKVK
jgi:pyruvate formate lyase activating enzyme